MKPRRRCFPIKQRRWTVNEWEAAWELASVLIEGAPLRLAGHCVFKESLAMLNGAFVEGKRSRFELGLITLLDVCAEAVNEGECKQWWD